MITSAAGVCIDKVFLSAVNAAVLFSGGGGLSLVGIRASVQAQGTLLASLAQDFGC